MDNGVCVYGVVLGHELGAIALKRAVKRKMLVDQVLLELIRAGLEHERLCGERENHKRLKK